ncbi:hypothetical protein DLAC_02637 [Tieghemostelium lacteum]|uniref:MJ1316 RNA cyclic group end recognition domain-containing protein n=1 Tax=Tieghemostelium lacteum TaxID=361077 RepID=A0A152A2Y0_TIELA|nr:hypothetical protein DLAC_02637 [Tieghemostelium lacteum]|eukprot:KYR00613.1 hypothetical protein DLAC_02637 [Tieghemostelium lacteum]
MMEIVNPNRPIQKPENTFFHNDSAVSSKPKSSNSSEDEWDDTLNERKKKKEKKIKVKITEEPEPQKKERFPAAEEIYNRILWDLPNPKDKNDFVVGYEDRFVGIIDVLFTKYELGEIPLHRVRYFKYKGEIFYDRRDKRYDFPDFPVENN